jgi:YVTN family beta-propeller protein
VAGGGNPGSVYQYSINQSTGALTSIGSINSGNTPTGIVVDPTGRFVYVGNDAASGVVYGFSINQSTGALISGIGTVSAGSYPAYVSVDPTGRYVYAANTNSNTVSQFAINQSTGALIPITSAISCGTIPFGITVDPTGRFLYTANYGSANVSQYMINNFSAGNFSAGVMTGTATSAQYADLAENYVSDQQYDYGIVLMIGGDEEVTIAAEDTQRLAGVVSQNPGYLMNSECEGKHVVAIALQGRTPVRVKGNVRKGDFLVSAGDGYAKATDNPRIGSIIGKSLESFDGQYGMVEAMVGRI